MARKPFDPDKAKGANPDRPVLPARRGKKRFGNLAAADHLTVSQAADLIKNTLEQHIPSSLKVIGEVSNLGARGHWYFSLKDEEAVLSCVAWQSTVRKLKFTPKDGDEVVATGHVSHYPPQGRTQFYVTNLKPVGEGALERRFREMCAELRGLGYFEEARKKTLPSFPRKIAVITSRTGAAVQDVINTAGQRCPAVGLVIVDVRVQGEVAKDEVARAIAWVDANHKRLGVDAILVTRGGGSMEDLWAFNERVVADAAFACSIPLVAAIGHESDTTVIELVADRRAATPTQAAMMLVPDAADLTRQVDHLAHRLHQLLQRELDRKREQLRAIEMHAMFRDPRGIIVLARERVEALRTALERAVRLRLQAGSDCLSSLARHLQAVDPRKVLERGYSLTEKADGTLLRSVAEVSAGDRLITVLADGSVGSVVEGKPAADKPAPTRHQRASKIRKDINSGGQLDLFGRPK